jgi:hypothetical protein
VKTPTVIVDEEAAVAKRGRADGCDAGKRRPAALNGRYCGSGEPDPKDPGLSSLWRSGATLGVSTSFIPEANAHNRIPTDRLDGWIQPADPVCEYHVVGCGMGGRRRDTLPIGQNAVDVRRQLSTADAERRVLSGIYKLLQIRQSHQLCFGAAHHHIGSDQLGYRVTPSPKSMKNSGFEGHQPVQSFQRSPESWPTFDGVEHEVPYRLRIWMVHDANMARRPVTPVAQCTTRYFPLPAVVTHGTASLGLGRL